MTQGFTVDPGELLAYAAQLGQLAGQVGVADNAVNTVINENSGTLGPVTRALTELGVTKTGHLDRAYGLICQPFGIALQNMQQQAEKGIEQTMQLISTLAEQLKNCAHNYQDADHLATASIKQAGSEMDGLAAAPRLPSSTPAGPPGLPKPPLPRRMPQIPMLPNQDEADG